MRHNARSLSIIRLLLQITLNYNQYFLYIYYVMGLLGFVYKGAAYNASIVGYTYDVLVFTWPYPLDLLPSEVGAMVFLALIDTARIVLGTLLFYNL